MVVVNLLLPFAAAILLFVPGHALELGTTWALCEWPEGVQTDGGGATWAGLQKLFNNSSVGGLECGNTTVPLDYASPASGGGATINVFTWRVRAAGLGMAAQHQLWPVNSPARSTPTSFLTAIAN